MTAEDLRKSILQQAIQGKLVPQDPNDEPASVLLERIREEKARLVKEKKIKKDKNESIIYRGEDNSHYEKFADGTIKCIDEEIPYDIPQNWSWCRFSNIVNLNPIVTADDNDDVAFMPMASIDAGYSGKYSFETKKWAEVKKGFTKIATGDIAYAKITPCFQNRKSFILGDVPSNVAAATTELNVLRIYNNTLNPKYILYFLKSEYFIKEAKLKGTAGQQRVIPNYVQDKLFPLPPIAEQERISNRISELLIKSITYDILYKQLLSFETELQPQLKKSILQYAIQGKLVVQNPTDEPASELLKRINEEKEQLIKAGKIKRDKNTSIIFKGDDNKYFEKKGSEVVCIDDEIPFEIPDSWEWVRFKNVAIIARGGSPRPIKSYLTENPNGVNWIKIGDTEKGGKYINSVKEKIKPEGVSSSRMVHKGDFLLTNSMSFGRPYITNVDGCIHDGWLVISPFANTFIQDYLFHLLSSAFAYNQFSGKVSGAVVKNLNIDKVLDAIIPLPPLQEQKRIVMALDNVLASIMRN